MEDWRKNLILVWLTQFLSLAAFQLGLPLMPYYIQHLGITDPDSVKLWTAAMYGASFVPFAIMAPIWGMLADRYGRRIMMLRANFSAVVILILMAYAPNVETLLVLRFFQGFLTGTITAAQVLVASSTPPEKQGMAIGAVSSALFSGSLVGSVLGGFIAEGWGYRPAFQAAAVVMLVGACLVFTIRENFQRPAAEPVVPGGPKPWRTRLMLLVAVWPILAAVAGAGMARMYDGPMLPLLVQELQGTLEGSAGWLGLINGAASIAAVTSAILLGRASDNRSPATIAAWACVGGSVFMFLCAFAPTVWSLLPIRFAMILFLGGIDPMMQAWIARCTPAERRGFVMGFAVSARAVGWVLGPILSGAVAVGLSLRAVFALGPILLLGVIPLVRLAERRMARAAPLVVTGSTPE